LYPCLQALEIGFRNSIHLAVSQVTSNPNWILRGDLLKGDPEREMHAAALEALRVRNKPHTAGYLISELKFRFWTTLCDSRYERLWHQAIRLVVPGMPNHIRTRREVSKRMNEVRRLRNAVSHHHSIWHWADLGHHHETIHEVLGWIAPEYDHFVRRNDRFPEVFKKSPEAYLA
jgi:hypothetical protein